MSGPLSAHAGRRPLDSAPFLNPFDPVVQAQLEAVFTELRAKTSVVRTPLGASVLRRDAVHRLLGDQRLVSAVPFLLHAQVGSEASVGMLRDTILAMDGPQHARLRRLVARSFTHRAADRHRSTMRTVTHTLIDNFAPGRCEFMAEFADQYPIQVMCEALGVPRQDHRCFAEWSKSLTHALSLDIAGHVDEIAHAAEGLGSYVDQLVKDRRASPRDDLVSELVEIGEHGDRLSGRELRAMIAGLLFAGYDTTCNQLGHGLFTFTRFPDQWSLLAEQPELAGQAVDEVMRLHGAVIGVPRITAAEVEVDGWVIPPSTVVFLSLASANRDDTVFDEPLNFDITAPRAPHLSFGGGPHYCLGANLARAEMEEALRILPIRLRHLHLDGDVEWRTATAITGPWRLPLAFDRT
jgi:cytochrome P450